MESPRFQHRRLPSSDRFIGMFSNSPPPSSAAGGELIEAEVFWTGDFSEPKSQQNQNRRDRDRTSFVQRSGILAVLPDYSGRALQVLCRKTSISQSPREIPTIPRPPMAAIQDRDLARQSAPVNVPAMASRRRSFEEEEEGSEEDEKVLPPHEMAARGSGVSPRTTFSVLEGVGRTLKGRDLRQVRNAIWRQTGFLD